MMSRDPHDKVKELFAEITASWPHTDRLDLPEMSDVLDDLPEPEDLSHVLDNIPDINLPDFPEQIPDVDPVALTDHARRALQAAGEFQHAKARGRNKRSGQSASERHPSAFTIADLALDKKRPCA